MKKETPLWQDGSDESVTECGRCRLGEFKERIIRHQQNIFIEHKPSFL